MRREKRQPRNYVSEIQSMLKKAVNTQVPMLLDTPPNRMTPQLIQLTTEDMSLYQSEMSASGECNVSLISKARDSVRFNRAVNAFRQAGIPANSYSHIGYYQIPNTQEDQPKQYRYMLLW